MPLIRIRTGVQLYYTQVGTGPDLVLIAGLSADHTVWAFVLEALAKHFRVLAFDNRGVGRSDAPAGPYTLATMADDTAALMDALSIHEAHTVGHSMGGAILQQMCIMHPKKIRRAVICASAARIPTASRMHIESITKLREANVSPTLVLESGFPWIFGEMFLQDNTKVVLMIDTLVNTPSPQTLAAFKAQVHACVASDLQPKLGAVTAPTLVIAGRDDILTPLRCSETIQRGIPGATLVTIDDCGHMLQIERPERFCSLVHGFCR